MVWGKGAGRQTGRADAMAVGGEEWRRVPEINHVKNSDVPPHDAHLYDDRFAESPAVVHLRVMCGVTCRTKTSGNVRVMCRVISERGSCFSHTCILSIIDGVIPDLMAWSSRLQREPQGERQSSVINHHHHEGTDNPDTGNKGLHVSGAIRPLRISFHQPRGPARAGLGVM